VPPRSPLPRQLTTVLKALAVRKVQTGGGRRIGPLFREPQQGVALILRLLYHRWMSKTLQAVTNFVNYAMTLDGDEKGEAQVFCDRLFQAFDHK
jgi:hypothetical protein